jgi:hypothetical protein
MKLILLTTLIVLIAGNGIKKLINTPNFLKSLNYEEEASKIKKRLTTVIKDLNISLYNNDYYSSDEPSFTMSDLILTKFTETYRQEATAKDYQYKIDENNIYIMKLDKPFKFSFTANFRKSYIGGLLNFDGTVKGTISVDKITVKETFKQDDNKLIKTDNIAIYLDKTSLKYSLDGLISRVIDIPKRVTSVFNESLYYVLEGKLNKSINTGFAKDKVSYKI